MPISGRFIAASSTGSPYRTRTSRLAAAFPLRSSASERRPADADRASDPTRSVSIPFRMPTRSAGATTQDAVESEAELRRLNLARVLPADRGDQGRVVDPALQQADASPVFEPVDRQQLPRQVEPREPVGREQPLIGEVVNREHARHRRPARDAPRRACADRPARAPPASRARARPTVGRPAVRQTPARRGPAPRSAAGCPDSRRCRHRTARRDRTGPGSRSAARGLRPRAALRRIRRLACSRRR